MGRSFSLATKSQSRYQERRRTENASSLNVRVEESELGVLGGQGQNRTADTRIFSAGFETSLKFDLILSN